MIFDAAVHRFFRAIDTRDWETVETSLAEDVRLDYTTLFGGEPEVLSAGEVIDRWRGLLPGFDATLHFLGPLVEEGDNVECNVRGYHHLDGRTWMVAGWYSLTLTERHGLPLIAAITIEVSYEEGDRDLVAAAQERAASEASAK